jgi:hypothetical protein
MKGDLIEYKSGYKYQLHSMYAVDTPISPTETIQTRYIVLHTDGRLVIRAGYAWDGPSGPTIDTKSFMRGSLVHDALYQLIRLKLLDSKWRPSADDMLYQICREDGMNRVRAWYVRLSMRTPMAKAAASADNRRRVIIAP